MKRESRIIVRSFQPSDLEDLHDYAKIAGVGEAAGWKHHESQQETELLLHRFTQNRQTYAIQHLKTKAVIGHITIHDDSVDKKTEVKELGFVLHPLYQGQGIMTEVIKVVLKKLFNENIDKVYMCCIRENKKSKGLIEKCQFSFEGEGEFFSSSLNQSFPSFEYFLTKKQWLNTPFYQEDYE